MDILDHVFFFHRKWNFIGQLYFGCSWEVLVKSPDKLSTNVCVRHFISYMEGYYAMGTSVSGDTCNQSRIYSGPAKSLKPSSSQGNSEGDDKYRALCVQCVDLPALWGYAISMESEKAKYKQIKAKYEQIKAKYNHIKSKYKQIKAKYGQVNSKFDRSVNQTCYCSTSAVIDHHVKDKTKFNDQEPLLKMWTDDSVENRVSLSHEIMNVKDHGWRLFKYMEVALQKETW